MTSAAAVRSVIPVERIASQMYVIRRQTVMFDADLASLYRVETRALIQAVKRNVERFLEISCSGLQRRNSKIGDHKL